MTDRTVPAEVDGQRLDVAVASLLEISRSRAASFIDEGRVAVDGEPMPRSGRVRAGQTISVDEPEPAPSGASGVPPPPVRYEDDHLLVVSKPPGLVVHPGTGNPAGTLVQALAAAGVPLASSGDPERPGIVHRLDRDTSGLLVVAKTDAAHSGLVSALKRREVERRYLALAQGTLPSVRGRVDAPIGRDPANRLRFAAVPDGKPAVTHWRQLATGRSADRRVALLACRLETGRTHQIRVHLAFAASPVVGDHLYGADPDVTRALGLQRPFLHAADLRFAHPITGRDVEVSEPLPSDLLMACENAGIAAVDAVADPETI